MIASLQCLSHSDVLTIEGMQDMTTIGVNQLPFVYIAHINSPSQQGDAKHDIYKVVFKDLEFKNCEVKSDHLINIG